MGLSAVSFRYALATGGAGFLGGHRYDGLIMEKLYSLYLNNFAAAKLSRASNLSSHLHIASRHAGLSDGLTRFAPLRSLAPMTAQTVAV